jgi:hypothetical protein
MPLAEYKNPLGLKGEEARLSVIRRPQAFVPLALTPLEISVGCN